MVCRVITCFIEYLVGWADDTGIELRLIDCRYITSGKLLEEIREKKGISLRIQRVIPTQIPDKLSRRVIRLMIREVSMTDKHCISTW